MKKLIVALAAAALLIGGVAIADITYAPISPDNTVPHRNLVRVRETNSRVVVDTRVLTIQAINKYIVNINQQIQELQAAKAEWLALRDLVQTEADKVILYVPPPE